MSPLLTFISDESLLSASKKLIDAVTIAHEHAGDNPYRNVIDPFSALFDAAYHGISLEDWMDQEIVRQVQKSLQNALGEFHQNILGSMPGWRNAQRGGSYDVINTDLKLIAEIKNKHNTMNSRSSLSVYDNLHRHLDYGLESYKAYLVAIIPASPELYETPFTPSERGQRRQERDDIVKIDGQSFYNLASGEPDALRQLYQVLPEILGRMLENGSARISGSPLFSDLFNRAFGLLQ